MRQHVQAVIAAGVGLKRLGALTGVPNGVLWKLVYGRTRADGSRRLSAKVRTATADRLLAVAPGSLSTLAGGALVPAFGAQRRLQALVALGWSQAKLAARLGIASRNFGPVVQGRDCLTVSTVRAVAALFDALQMTLPPERDRYARIAASRARGYARARGWAPPLAWDDIDDPNEVPAAGEEPALTNFVDEAAVIRRAAGDRVQLNQEERAEVVRRLRARGLTYKEIALRTGLRADRYADARSYLEEAS